MLPTGVVINHFRLDARKINLVQINHAHLTVIHGVKIVTSVGQIRSRGNLGRAFNVFGNLLARCHGSQRNVEAVENTE